MSHIPINEIPWEKQNHDTRKASEARKRKVVMISQSGKQTAFESIKEASMKTGICKPCICRCCKGKQGASFGFRLKYV